ncbi:MAG TPA: DUF3866 family protein [Limnochordia bacterium]
MAGPAQAGANGAAGAGRVAASGIAAGTEAVAAPPLVRWEIGRVAAVLRDRPGVQELLVETGGGRTPALHYPALWGPAAPGDRVLLNTTAVHLGLGTGGQHFVAAVLSRPSSPELPFPGRAAGHVMKLRYTPGQVRVHAAEEPTSPYRARLEAFTDLGGLPVIACSVHSLLAPVALGWRTVRSDPLVYVMTDGGALPAWYSRLANDLCERGWLAGVITVGHAFGGDLEAVTLHSGLALAKVALDAAGVVVAMGPGVVGTGTALGTTAIEQGIALDAAAALGGRGVACPRISFADRRPRHRGISHHTLTALCTIAHRPATVVLPALGGREEAELAAQAARAGLAERHTLVWEPTAPLRERLERHAALLRSMGRSFDDDPAFFLAGAAAGAVAARLAAPPARPD